MKSKDQKIIAVLTAMEDEKKYVVNHLNNYENIKINRFCFTTGSIDNKKIIVSLTGIGKVNASLATTILSQQFNIDLIINTGSAGSIKNDITLGDVVIGENIAHHDVDLSGFNYPIGQIPKLPRFFVSNQQLIEKINQLSPILGKQLQQKIINGLIVSGDQFIDKKAKIDQIKQNFPNALAVEMESAAIAQSCHQLQIPFLIIRAISDYAQPKNQQSAKQDFTQNLAKAAKNSAFVAIELIKNI